MKNASSKHYPLFATIQATLVILMAGLSNVTQAPASVSIVTADEIKKFGHRTITISTACHSNDVEVRVSDTGTGIPEDLREKVFEPFFTTKDIGEGTGQGLAIARSVIVDKHGGTIRFETQVGIGTTFILRLPLSPPTEPTETQFMA